MNSNSGKKFKPEQAFESDISKKSVRKKTDIYDVINSEDLDLLYKKNAHLLSRLSSTGRQNGILQTEVHSLLAEKSKLDIKNNFLKTKVDSLKDQVSLFARQQRGFNQQSLRLKKELNGLKVDGFKLLDERADIVKDKSLSQKLIHHMNYRKKVRKAHCQIKEKRNLSSEKEQKYEEHLSRLEHNKSLVKEKEQQILLLEKREMVHIRQIQSLEKQYFESKTIQDTQFEDINKLKIIMESSKNENQEFSQQEEREKKLHDLIQILKHQQEDLLKENESYENQVNLYQLYQEENKTLSENYNNLRGVLSQQEEGFKQTLLSYRKKYMEIRKKTISSSKQVELKSLEILRFKNLLNQSQESFEIEKRNLKRALLTEKQNEISTVLTELEIKNKENLTTSQQLQNLKSAQNQEFSKLQEEYLDEIRSLKLKLNLQSSQSKEEQERSVQNIKNEYESRISGLDISYKKRLQHIRTEMENDLLNERRRSEIFKSMKEKQTEELETHLEQLQKESHGLQTSNFALENSNKGTTFQLKKEISKNEYLITQNKNLHSLWHQIQQSLEKKEQQIQSLQKLNKNLSLSFNEITAEKAQSPKEISFFNLKDESPAKNLEFKSDIKEASTKESSSKATHNILADIHFD